MKTLFQKQQPCFYFDTRGKTCYSKLLCENMEAVLAQVSRGSLVQVQAHADRILFVCEFQSVSVCVQHGSTLEGKISIPFLGLISFSKAEGSRNSIENMHASIFVYASRLKNQTLLLHMQKLELSCGPTFLLCLFLHHNFQTSSLSQRASKQFLEGKRQV